jgi:hypothetical protein
MKLPTRTCKFCKHVWIPRNPVPPKQCPNCAKSHWGK